jgi:hypothetical protein
MSGITVTLNDEITPLLERVRTAAQAQGLALLGARAVGNVIRAHLVQLNAERHHYGRNYYAQAAQSVTTAALGTGAAVSITQVGIRQRYYGGPIDPKNSTYLTIPACPEAMAHRASEFSDLRFTYAPDDQGNMRPALVRNYSQIVSIGRRKKADGSVQFHVLPGSLMGGEVMFWLVKHVDQAPDSTVLPEPAAMSDAASKAIGNRLQRMSDRANPESN